MSVFFAILLFSFLIFIHELGHFVAAKSFGVQVNEFSLFMGPALWSKQIGETQYSLRLFPIGGFCAMEGEDGESDNPRSFGKAAWWKRLMILGAGAAMNFVIGVLLMVIAYLPVQRAAIPVVSSFGDFATVTGEGGLQVGDRILEMDGERIYVQGDLSMIMKMNPGDVHDLVVERNGEKIILDDFLMEKHEIIDASGAVRLQYGINFKVVDLSLRDRLDYAWNQCLDTVRITRLSLQMLLRGEAGIRDMSGPVGIVQIMSETADAAPTRKDAAMNMLYWGAFLGINLAVMNLLPIPALDGGRVAGLLITTAVEAVTGKKVNPKYEGYFHGIGMILMLILMAVIMFKDIFYLFKR